MSGRPEAALLCAERQAVAPACCYFAGGGMSHIRGCKARSFRGGRALPDRVGGVLRERSGGRGEFYSVRGRREAPFVSWRPNQMKQGGLHFVCVPEAVFGIIGTGPEDNGREFGRCATGRRKRLSADTPLQRLFSLYVSDWLGISGEEGQPVSIEQLIENKAERIEIHSGAIGLSKVDLRRHVALSPFFGKAAGRLLSCPGDAEVSKFEKPSFADKDVFPA